MQTVKELTIDNIKKLPDESTIDDIMEAIADYIAKESPRYAAVFLENIFQYAETLTLFPAECR